ncbi:MAG TPA: TetR/AcrR family transcriptional regulator [Candidatus Dormibacteraeota bacterium]
MATRLTREERKARTRVELIAAAARVFARKGFHAATVDDVALEAGFTKGAFYSNFESKEDVFVELVADRSRSWTIAVARAYEGDEPLADRLRKGGDVLTRMIEEESDWMLLWSELWSQSIRDPHLRQRLADAYEECRRVIARLVAEVETEFGVRFPIPSDQVAALTVAMTDGFVLQRLAEPDRLPAHLLADGLNLLVTGTLMAAGVTPRQQAEDRPPAPTGAATRPPAGG